MARTVPSRKWLGLLAIVVLVLGSSTAAGADPEPATRPAGAATPGTDEWYTLGLPDATITMLGVYRPEAKGRHPAVLVLHGKDGPRRLYEELAQRYAREGFIAIVACWFQYVVPEHEDAYACPGVGEFVGAEEAVVADVDAVVDSLDELDGVRRGHLGVVGQSYGARIALLRASASGGDEPVVSSCGNLAAEPLYVEPETTRYPFPADPSVAAAIEADVLVVHGEADPITPIGQAEVFVTAMAAAGRSVDLVAYATPAGHSIPWDVVTALDDPDDLLRDRFLADTVGWLRDRLA